MSWAACPPGRRTWRASRFWPFQVIEAGWLLALSAILIAASVWLVRRRAAWHRTSQEDLSDRTGRGLPPGS